MAEERVDVLYCANHPGRETVLRCNRCGKPICTQCAIRTPVGYRCRECVAEQQAVYYTGRPYDLGVAIGIALPLAVVAAALASALLGMLGLYGFVAAVFAGPAVGGALAEIVRRGVGRRRSRYLSWVVAGTCGLGMLAGGYLWPGLFLPTVTTKQMIAGLLGRFDVLLLAALATSTVYARLK